MHATARAGINIALVKYWGKRDDAENLPAVGSLSLTLDSPGTTTTVRFDAGLPADRFTLNGQERADRRVFQALDAVRAHAGLALRAQVTSENTVPTASGLASSASGAAALGLAAWAAAGLPTDDLAAQPALVALVRRASGSAPRSLLGGLVELDRDTTAVTQVLAPQAWDLRMVIAVMTHQEKKVKSRPGMTLTRETSPYYAAWVEHHAADLAAARAAIDARDLDALGAAMERSTLRMHACMLAADPPLRYLSGRTLDALDAVEALRADGVSAWATMDAGPHVKVLCHAADAARVHQALIDVVGVSEVLVARPGPGARRVGG
ncbi:MAG: diphosphomevalonate decarboxylase [Myxococcales bacterium]|nr:diphosphomevalonate decarboxylase [Myxococcales bacterium]MCB9524104.1 diphosphomevalonate decarboxylase [Myxococcales bacterium]